MATRARSPTRPLRTSTGASWYCGNASKTGVRALSRYVCTHSRVSDFSSELTADRRLVPTHLVRRPCKWRRRTRSAQVAVGRVLDGRQGGRHRSRLRHRIQTAFDDPRFRSRRPQFPLGYLEGRSFDSLDNGIVLRVGPRSASEIGPRVSEAGKSVMCEGPVEECTQKALIL